MEKTVVCLLGKRCGPAPRRLPRQSLRSPTRLGPRMPHWRLLMPQTRGLTTLSSFGLPSAAARGGETSSLVACGACFLKLNGALKLDLNTVQAAKKTEFPGPALPGTRLSDANGSGGRPGQRHQQQQRRRRQQQNNGSSKRNATAAAARGHLRKHGTNKRTKAECQLAFLCTHSNNACGTCLCNLHKMVMQCLCTGAGHKQQHHLQNH